MTLSEEIRARLETAFQAQELEVINESHLHSGHAGDDGSGESHFRVVLTSSDLAPLNRVARHRAVHGAIGKDILSKIHALALDLSA